MCVVIVGFLNLVRSNVFLRNRNIVDQFKSRRYYISSSSAVVDQFLKNHHPSSSTRMNNQALEGLFTGNVDRYQGVTVISSDEPCDVTQFTTKLEASLKRWGEKNVRGVWFQVALEHADWVPVLAKNGFVFHHTRNQFVTMYKWLPKTETCNIPPFAHTMVGVGAVVVNSADEILVVQERFFNVPHWKLPGGYVEPGENFGDAAVREVLEETNVTAEFQFLITLRHTHHGMFGCSDIYIIAGLTPLTLEIKKCDREIADCKWMKIQEFLDHPQIHDGNKFFVRKYLEYRDSGNKIGCLKNIHPVLKKPQCVYSITNEEKLPRKVN
ncbi:uncharacterized protein [Anabrus simplex]|uniref:uncharacterized protein n=1 Tax=Anabrus simplex TaxID=316456 RepID=UPI0034DDBB5A